MSRWFRFYAEALDNPKVQKLRPELFKAWVNILCIASKNGGRLPALEDLAFALRVDEEKAGEIVGDLIVRRLLDRTEDGFTPHDWSERQYQSDSSADRVKRYRDRYRNGEKPVTETPPEAETDTEAEAEAEPEEKNSNLISLKDAVSERASLGGFPSGRGMAEFGKWGPVIRELCPNRDVEAVAEEFRQWAKRLPKPPDISQPGVETMFRNWARRKSA